MPHLEHDIHIFCSTGDEFHQVDPECSKIINFDFNYDLESYTECHIRTYAIPAGDPTVANGVLCLMGEEDFVTVSITYVNIMCFLF